MKNIARILILALSQGLGLTASLQGVTLIDQIGDPTTFELADSVFPNVSQIFSDFPAFDSLVLEDFEIDGEDLTVRSVQVLFFAQNGFASFDLVSEYRLGFFDDPSLASDSLLGNVASVSLPSLSEQVIVSRVGEGASGLVTLLGEWELPESGQYWVGVAPVAANSVAGQFFLANGGEGAMAGGANGIFVNPDEGFGQGTSQDVATDFAVLVSTERIPEPNTVVFVSFFAALGLCSRRRKEAV